jgi:hypothetical protein
MTTTAEAPKQTHHLQVRTDPAGKPLAVRHDGQIWLVDPDTEAQHWFGGDVWPDSGRTAPAGSSDPVSIEYWRIQVRLGASDAALQTFELRRDPLAEQWTLESIINN